MNSLSEIIVQQGRDAFQRLGAQGTTSAEEIAESILHQVVYWEKQLPDGTRLLFVRLFSPVVQREEVFLGNILLNDFLSKCFVRAVTEGRLGQVELAANDIESYHFLVRTSYDLAQLIEAFRAEVERSLAGLFFGEQDETRGVYGSLETMLDFDKANVEPFPVFIMPRAYAERLEKAVRKSLLHKIEMSALDRNPTSIMANLAFFYSHDGAEMQSPYLFMARLALRYGVLSSHALGRALNLDDTVDLSDEAAVKSIIENSLKQKEGRTFSAGNLRAVLKQAVINLGQSVDTDPDNWQMPHIRNKFLSQDGKGLARVLLSGVLFGHFPMQPFQKMSCVSCRVCGVRLMEAEDKSILMGQSTHRFHNQAPKQKNEDDPKTCLRCAVCTYLMVKLIGSEAIGQPQVPKTYNLIFHYGRHDERGLGKITKGIDLTWSLVRRNQAVARVRYELQELENKLQGERRLAKQKDLAEQIAQKQGELQEAHAARDSKQQDLLALHSDLEVWDVLETPNETPSLDVLSQLQFSETKTERHILGLGMGGYRMILFVLPQLKRPPQRKGGPPPDPYLVQRRFSDSRVTVTAFLSFLRQLCGCDGPFYYQSLPKLTPEGFNLDVFYIRNEPIRVDKAQREYEVVTQLAWKLVKRRRRESGQEMLVRKVLLAEQLLADPLGIFSAVMRDSAVLGAQRDPQKQQYRRLKTVYRPDWQAHDMTEYGKFIQQILKL